MPDLFASKRAREERADCRKRLEDIRARVAGERRDATPAEAAEMEALAAQIDYFSRQIPQLEAALLGKF